MKLNLRVLLLGGLTAFTQVPAAHAQGVSPSSISGLLQAGGPALNFLVGTSPQSLGGILLHTLGQLPILSTASLPDLGSLASLTQAGLSGVVLGSEIVQSITLLEAPLPGLSALDAAIMPGMSSH